MKKPQNPSRSRKTPDLVKKPQEWERWFGAITMSYRYTTGSIRVVQFLIRNNVRVDLLYRANRNRSFCVSFFFTRPVAGGRFRDAVYESD